MGNEAEVESLRAELDTGLTMAQIALDASHAEKTERNRTNARKAYDSLLHFIPRTQLEPEIADEIDVKLEQLRLKLHELGEVL